MIEKINILDVLISNLTTDEIVTILIERLENNLQTVVYTPNSEIIENFRKDTALLAILNSADILSADGAGVVYASKILGTPLKSKAAGFDIATRLLEKPLKFYFFGGKPGTAELAKQNILKKYPKRKIVGTENGYDYDNARLIEEINSVNPDVLFVCLGAEKQERWIYENKKRLPNAVILGIGGTLDVLAGNVKRAPDLFVKMNLEWFYRLIKQPSRFVRMLAIPKFLFTVLVKKITTKK